MRVRRISTILLAFLSAAACQTVAPPEPQDVSFARGCWISRQPDRTTRTLRFLPARDGTGAMEGELMTYGAGPGAAPPLVAKFLIASDGSTFEQMNVSGRTMRGQHWAHPPTPLPAGWSRAAWASEDRRIWIALEGDADHLTMWRQAFFDLGDMATIMFKGERDGCD